MLHKSLVLSFSPLVFLLLSMGFYPAITVKAQPWTDVASVRYIQLPEVGLPAVNLSWFHTDLAYGFSSGRNTFALNPAFEKLSVTAGKPLYSLSLPLLYSRISNDSVWKFSFISIGRINSDLTELSSDDLQAGIMHITSFRKSPQLKYRFGFYINTEFQGLLVLPLLGLEWRANDRFLASSLLPILAMAEYRLFPAKFHCGMIFRAFNRSFRYGSGSYLAMQDSYFGFFSDFYFTRTLLLNAEAGYTLLRKYKTGIRTGNNKSEEEINSRPGAMFRIAFIYRIRNN